MNIDRNTRTFVIKGLVLLAVFFGITFLFRFPIDYFHLTLLKMTEATRVFSKSDGLKVFALAGLFFTLYFQKRISKLSHPKQCIPKTVLFGVIGFLLVTGYYGLRYLSNAYEITEGLPFYSVYAASLAALVLAFASFLIATYSIDYLKRFYSSFRKELWITAIASVIAYNLLMLFQEQWLFFSSTITRILASMFSPFFSTVYDLSGAAPSLRVADFAVFIGPPCSGIESMFLFVAFSIGIFALDHAKLKKLPFLASSIIGFVGVYFVNILRLFLLMLTGIYVSPEFAVGLFHTNIGWLLFVVYFLCYYLVIRRFIYLKDVPQNPPETGKGAVRKGSRLPADKRVKRRRR